ncbi:hypothetical protein SAMN04487866_12311 [Thermoactinomyces sp. DSM 45891]|uniref:hypothetical protein n=1 Tax=Thermoactinomyces sp. DSM 45891 TaxID=1761907 RepID=UPI0009230228|nr:hypothetical protein [Thermoactinomyces sp. DSM 45891]SFX76072.1 hypothetical protein SAMN04487866_12311 [Thermoactinomyces sp. DSM 45891]
MNLTLEQAGALLNKVGYAVTVANQNLRKITKTPYDGYDEIKKVGERWVYGYMVIERTNTPYFQEKKQFSTENEATVYYFLRSLFIHYKDTIVLDFNRKHMIYIDPTVADPDPIYQAFQLAGIPRSKFCFNEPPTNTCMHLEQTAEDKCTISLVVKGKVVRCLPFQDYPWGLSVAYSDTFLLHLFQTKLPKLLQSEGITEELTAQDLDTYLYSYL